MKLYGYWRSSATYRIRIVLALKGVDYDYVPVNLLAGDQREHDHVSRQPQGLVPAFETSNGAILTQSLAIAEYLDEVIPEPAPLPKDAVARAHARAIAATLACEAQPFMNLRIQKYLRKERAFSDDAMADWLGRWVGGAMKAAESLIDPDGPFAAGPMPGLADAFIVPQVFGATRFGVDMATMPRMQRVVEACAALEPFQIAHPDNQPDKPAD